MGHLRDLALRARSFLRPPTHKLKRLNPDLGYFGGVTWVYHAEVTNDAGVTAGHEYVVEPGQDNEFELAWGYLQNGDSGAAKNGFININANGELIGNLMGFRSIPAGVRALFPDRFAPIGTGPHEQIAWVGGKRLMLSGLMQIEAEILSVAGNKHSEFAIVGRVRGDKPTVTITTSNPGVTAVIHTNEFF